MKKILLLAISLITITSPLQAATEVSSGTVYASGSELKVTTHGIEFNVPDKWQAMLPPASDLMIMQTTDSLGRMLVTSVSNSDAQAVRQMLNRPHALDAMTRIMPDAEVTEKDGLFSQNYRVSGVNLQKLVATAYGRLGDNKTAVFVIMLEPENQKTLQAVGKQFIESVTFTAPESAAQARAEAGGGEVDWQRELRGRALEYVKTDDGRSIKKRISLCSDGRVYYSNQDRFADRNEMSHFTANTQVSQNGRWQISGDMLQLLLSDDSQIQYRLSERQLKNSDVKGLYLADERWFVRPNRACR